MELQGKGFAVYGWTFFPICSTKSIKIQSWVQGSDTEFMKNEWVYYLNLSASLDSNFIGLDQSLKKCGQSLVPINLSDLLSMTRAKTNVHVVICVDRLNKLKYFNQRVRKVMKYLLRRDNISIYILSSFESINDKKNILNRKNYFFTSIPVSFESYSYALSQAIYAKDEKVNSWPGARRRVHPSGEIF